MPFVHLAVRHAEPSATQVADLQAGLTRLMAEVLRKRADLTVVEVDVRPDAQLAIGGHPLAQGAWSGHLVAHVTAGTNTDAEKERFLDAAYRLLCERFRAPAAPFYIVVQELPAAAWGYDGRSQAWRAQAATPVAA